MPDGGHGVQVARDSRRPRLVAGENPWPVAGSCQGGPLLLAEVVVGNAGPRPCFTYRVPEALAATLCPGHLVEVPFGRRRAQGIVVRVGWGEAGALRLRDVAAPLDPLPYLTPAQIAVARWMADYYVCSLDEALGVMLPPGIDRGTITSYALPVELPALAGSRLTPLQTEMLERLATHGPATAMRLAAGKDLQLVAAALESLARRHLVQRAVGPARAGIAERSEQVVVLQPRRAGVRLTERQRAVVEYLERRGGEAVLAELREELGVDSAAVARLAARHVVLTYARQVRRDPLAHRTIQQHAPPPLTADQQRVYAPLRAALERQDGAVFLLHGVTGSGKTEVYLRAVADTLAAGRQAIILVPEIGLTPQTVSRFAGRFPGQVALLHSRLSEGERFDEWQRIRRGECAVAVGPRSAIFSPFTQLGLIVLDEEHDASYKQDRTPRYHTREVASRLARLTGATVVLGSATPDIVSFSRADRGEYRLLTMASRVAVSGGQHGGLPPVQVVDMRLELKAGNRSIFSRALQRAMAGVLARREQAILFLNRRGNATFVNCRDCGRVVTCRRCDLPFAYHSDGETLVCHRCDARAPLPTLCATCGSWRIRYFGLGTQKVERELQARFPTARVQRYDRDVTGGKLDHEAILDRFARGEADVLVGTQIVAKGLDFPRVTLVGAVSADTSLNLPDFRASERTFALLTQVAGRAGRADLPGRVIVQSYAPGHFAIQAAARHDYLCFYRDELRFRQESGYPPFSQLARLTVNDRSEDLCRTAAESLAARLQGWTAANPSANLEVIGPAPCFIGKAHDRYYWQILVRGAEVHPILSEVPRGWAIDVDPVSLL